ncbi:protein N-lysine methyltransferase METTL21D-like isoform X2 [Lycorma delicatula]
MGDVGCVVWDAAIVLSKYIETLSNKNKLNLKRMRVIELGAGLGCVGLTAACCGADVVMTDLPEILPLLEYNIMANKDLWQNKGGKAVSKPLKWSHNFSVDDWFQPDLLLLADCVYYSESLSDLFATALKLCSEKTELILCQEERDSEKQKAIWNSFLKLLDKDFDYYSVPEKEQHYLFHSPDISIIRAKKKV